MTDDRLADTENVTRNGEAESVIVPDSLTDSDALSRKDNVARIVGFPDIVTDDEPVAVTLNRALFEIE